MRAAPFFWEVEIRPQRCRGASVDALRSMPASSPPRANAWEWAQTALLAINLAWTALSLGGYLPQTQVVTGFLTTLLLFVHLSERADIRALLRRDNPGGQPSSLDAGHFHPAGWLMLPFLVFATVNVLWLTPARWLGWQDWFCWAQLIATFWVTLNSARSSETQQVLLATLLGLGVIGVALGCYQRFVQLDWMMLGRVQAVQFFGRASGSFGIPNSMAGFLLLLIPPCGALAFRGEASGAQRVFFGWVAGVLTFGLVLTISRGGWIALGVALTIWPLLSKRWRLRRRITVALAVLLLVGSTGGVLYRVSPKAQERFAAMLRDAGERSRPIMWRAAWQIFLQQPVLGSGAGTYNLRFERFRPEFHQAEPKWAHNEYLNTLAEYGLVGFVLCFGAGGYMAWRASGPPRDPTSRSSSARLKATGVIPPTTPPWIESARLHTALRVGLLAFAVQLCFDFHFKIPALALASATIAGIVVRRGWPANDEAPRVLRRRGRRIACAVAAAAVAMGGVFWNLPRLRAEGLRYPLRGELDALARRDASKEERISLATRARAAFSAAIELDPGNAQAWADRAYAIAILGHETPQHEASLGREAEADARRALAESEAAFEFWVRLGVALDMQRRWTEAGPAFAKGLELAPISAPAWFYQAYHFALNPVTVPLARSAVATCLRLDPSIREADALRRHLTAGR